MLDTEQNEPHTVWGIAVPRQANGRLQWPSVIKNKAVERILGGETVVSVATEIGANQSLVAKWASNVRDATAGPQKAPNFVEVVISEDTPTTVVGDTANPTVSCELVLGDVRLSITPDFPAANLTMILRAVRASQ